MVSLSWGAGRLHTTFEAVQGEHRRGTIAPKYRGSSVLEFLFEVFFELVLQVALEILAEFSVRGIAASSRKPVNPWFAAIGYGMVGTAVGGLSLLVFPKHFVATSVGQVVNLIATPILAGLAMSLLGSWRARRGEDLVRLDRFACGYLFALSLAIVRFHFAA